MKNKKKYYNTDKNQKPVNQEEELKVKAEEAPEDARIEDVVPDDEDGMTPEQEEKEAEKVLTAEDEIAALKENLDKEKKEYMYLMAEFENFRKRTMKEKAELIKNGGEKVLKGFLPVLDDFERGLKASGDATDPKAILEGMELIYNKLKSFLEQNGVKEMDPADDTFDTERHEAISVVPVPDEDKKGKILDTVQKGYTINDKVLRHAKVVVAQ